jgi:hypothetical protein
MDTKKAQRVCDLLAAHEEAKSLRQACKIVGIPPSNFLFWCDKNPELAEQYARADKIATDLAFEEFAELNDEAPPRVKGYTDAGWAAWQRMRLDNKKWAMSKRRPSKYGDKVAVENSGSIEVVKRVVSDL